MEALPGRSDECFPQPPGAASQVPLPPAGGLGCIQLHHVPGLVPPSEAAGPSRSCWCLIDPVPLSLPPPPAAGPLSCGAALTSGCCSVTAWSLGLRQPVVATSASPSTPARLVGGGARQRREGWGWGWRQQGWWWGWVAGCVFPSAAPCRGSPETLLPGPATCPAHLSSPGPYQGPP